MDKYFECKNVRQILVLAKAARRAVETWFNVFMKGLPLFKNMVTVT